MGDPSLCMWLASLSMMSSTSMGFLLGGVWPGGHNMLLATTSLPLSALHGREWEAARLSH